MLNALVCHIVNALGHMPFMIFPMANPLWTMPSNGIWSVPYAIWVMSFAISTLPYAL